MFGGYRARRQGWLAILAAIAGMLLAFAQQEGLLNDFWQHLETAQPGLYSVTQVSDGDTIVVDMNGHRERIRLIGVDTPETHRPNTPVQCYGPAASAFTTRVVLGKKVRLVSDPLSTNRDRYDRLLRYVYSSDGELINELLVRQGYGFYYPYFPFTKSQSFSAAQAQAKAAGKGLWGNCQPRPTDGGGFLSN